ncbi:MAG TPA: hypothetical protein PKI03_37190, partial [Pseudomonadota bacterium]|nr:hypothetical protein [Pseudomonadota bacterium]
MLMDRIWRQMGACLCALTVACTVPESQLNLRSEAGDDVVDLYGADLAVGAGQIGAPCKADAQC